MKLKLKSIDLKEKTLEDISINANKCDVQKFIDYIKEHLNKANALLDSKIENLSEIELYEKLKELFEFTVEKNDYLRALSKIYEKHYANFININTNMVDGEGNNISYQAAAISQYLYLDGSTLDLNLIRKLTNKNELLIIKKSTSNKKLKNKEKYENHQFAEIDINSCYLNEGDELFPYFTELLKKDIIIKDILYDIKLYIDELMYQAKSITNLSKIKDNEELALIGEKYRNALDVCFDEKIISKNRKISVPKHKKRK